VNKSSKRFLQKILLSVREYFKEVERKFHLRLFGLNPSEHIHINIRFSTSWQTMSRLHAFYDFTHIALQRDFCKQAQKLCLF